MDIRAVNLSLSRISLLFYTFVMRTAKHERFSENWEMFGKGLLPKVTSIKPATIIIPGVCLRYLYGPESGELMKRSTWDNGIQLWTYFRVVYKLNSSGKSRSLVSTKWRTNHLRRECNKIEETRPLSEAFSLHHFTRPNYPFLWKNAL